MKVLKKVVIGLVVVVLVVAVGLWLAVDIIAKAGIEKGAGYALGVRTRVDEAHVGLIRGKVYLGGLNVGNPEGFKTPHFMLMKNFNMEVDAGSLLSETVHVREFTMDGLDIHIEQQGLGKSNVSVIMDNVSQLSSPEKKEEASSGKKVKVDRVRVTNVTAHVQLLPVAGEASTLDIEVDEIQLDGVTSDNAAGVAIPELTARLVPAIIAAVLKKGQGVIPPDMAEGLNESVAGAAKAMGDQAGKLLEQSKGAIDKTMKDVGGAMQRLLGPKKSDEEEPKE